MSRLEDLEHDTGEEEEIGVSLLNHETPEPEFTRVQIVAEDRQQQRVELKERLGQEDKPWMDPENPALWIGSIGDEDD